jgi:hypothetical protein
MRLRRTHGHENGPYRLSAIGYRLSAIFVLEMIMSSYYQIRVKEYLGHEWSAWFDDFTIIHGADGSTTLAGRVPDQAALYGLLRKARDLGLTLLALYQVAVDAMDCDR